MEKNIQLYSMATPNGQKVSIALEEMGLSYTPHIIDITKNDQFSDEFIKLNPNSKIPVIVDPVGPSQKPITLFESGAILFYLAEKSGQLIPSDPTKKYECMQWTFFQVGHIGPMFGQFGHFFKYQGKECTDPYPLERYTKEAIRLLNVLDKVLDGRDFLVDNQYSIADIAIFPWVGGLDIFYKATEILKLNDYKNVRKWYERCSTRPKSIVGSKVCSIN